MSYIQNLYVYIVPCALHMSYVHAYVTVYVHMYVHVYVYVYIYM